jgi:hypothetical protein
MPGERQDNGYSVFAIQAFSAKLNVNDPNPVFDINHKNV